MTKPSAIVVLLFTLWVLWAVGQDTTSIYYSRVGKESEGVLLNNKPVGQRLFWDTSGKVVAKIAYENGVKDSIIWYKDGLEIEDNSKYLKVIKSSFIPCCDTVLLQKDFGEPKYAVVFGRFELFLEVKTKLPIQLQRIKTNLPYVKKRCFNIESTNGQPLFGDTVVIAIVDNDYSTSREFRQARYHFRIGVQASDDCEGLSSSSLGLRVPHKILIFHPAELYFTVNGKGEQLFIWVNQSEGY